MRAAQSKIRNEGRLFSRIRLTLLFLVFGWAGLTGFFGTVEDMMRFKRLFSTLATIVLGLFARPPAACSRSIWWGRTHDHHF